MYTTLSDHYREKFGCKVYKLAIDAGFSCPNRDGTREKWDVEAPSPTVETAPGGWTVGGGATTPQPAPTIPQMVPATHPGEWDVEAPCPTTNGSFRRADVWKIMDPPRVTRGGFLCISNFQRGLRSSSGDGRRWGRPRVPRC